MREVINGMFNIANRFNSPGALLHMMMVTAGIGPNEVGEAIPRGCGSEKVLFSVCGRIRITNSGRR